MLSTAVLLATCLFGDALGGSLSAPDVVTLSNGKVSLQLTAQYGYAISGFGPGKKDSYTNLINHHDEGREAQLSFYAGPRGYDPDKCGKKGWPNWPWNPIGAGDCYMNKGTLLHLSQASPDQVTIITRPLQWACDDVPCECTFRRDIQLVENTARVRAVLSNNRSDRTDYGNFGQELPAVYTISPLSQLITYNGSAPWTGAPMSSVPTPGNQPPWAPGRTTTSEGWAAFVAPPGSDGATLPPGVGAGQGVGLAHAQGISSFLLGFHGTKGPGGPTDDSTGYMAAFDTADLAWDIVYGYNFSLVFGTPEEVRREATRQHVAATAAHGAAPGVDVGSIAEGVLQAGAQGGDGESASHWGARGRSIQHPALWRPAVPGCGGSFATENEAFMRLIVRQNDSAALVSPAFPAPEHLLRGEHIKLRLKVRTCSWAPLELRAVVVESDSVEALNETSVPLGGVDQLQLSATMNRWAGASADYTKAAGAVDSPSSHSATQTPWVRLGLESASAEEAERDPADGILPADCPGHAVWQTAELVVDVQPGSLHRQGALLRVVLGARWEHPPHSAASRVATVDIASVQTYW